MSLTFVANQTLSTETCCKCGMLFAMPQDVKQKLLDNRGSSFYCPHGHGQHYIGESDEQKLKRQVAQLQTTIERKEAYEQTLRQDKERLKRKCYAIRGVVTRIKNRVQHGVCPCCNRTFQNLQRHMASKHPAYAKNQNEKENEQPTTANG